MRKTGPGRIITPGGGPAGGFIAALVNFDVDGDQLKREHKLYLDTAVTPLLRSAFSICIARGQASHTGSTKHNDALSKRRADNTVAHLLSSGAPPARAKAQHVGESMAGKFLGENDEARAVTLLVARTMPPPKPKPAPQPTPAPVAKTTGFAIRMLGSISTGPWGVTIEKTYWHIWAPTLARSTIYGYTGNAHGRGVSGVSATLAGDWIRFAANKPLGTDDFTGIARFTTAGGGPWSLNYLTFLTLPDGAATIPSTLRVKTGFTAGLGASSSVGPMLELETGPYYGL